MKPYKIISNILERTYKVKLQNDKMATPLADYLCENFATVTEVKKYLNHTADLIVKKPLKVYESTAVKELEETINKFLQTLK